MIWYSPLRVDTAKIQAFAFAAVLLHNVYLSAAQDQSTFAIFANTSDIYPLPRSSAGADALASTLKLQCPETIIFAIPSSSNPISNLTASDLNALCSTACHESLVSTAAAVDAACAGWPYILGDMSYVVSFPFQYLAYIWSLSCVIQGSEFCVNIAQTSPSTGLDSPIVDELTSLLCQNCTLDTLNIQMTSAFGWDASFVADWMTVQSKCGVTFNNTIPAGLLFDGSSPAASNGTSYNITVAPTLTPASANNCVYATYTVKTGDTCQSITAANSLPFYQLITINGLDMLCTKLPTPGGKICLSGSCPLYTVQANNTREGYMRRSAGWRLPAFDYSASNLRIPTGPIAPGSVHSLCGMWYEAAPKDTCPQILQIFQITNDTFCALNPNVNSDCSNLLAGFEYCVAVFGNATSTTSLVVMTTGASIISIIAGDFLVGTGTVVATGNMTVTPVTGSLPTTFTPTPTPEPTIAPGTIGEDSCLQYYTTQPGDTCLGIEAIFTLTDDEFRTWNPEIDANCANIQVGLAYCVFGPYVPYTASITLPPTSSAPTTTTSSTTSAPPAPTNVANGTITTGCTAYYTVQSGDTCTTIDTTFLIRADRFPRMEPRSKFTMSGDTCSVMETQYGITFDQIRQWNPEVDASCANIQPGFGYCVAGRCTAYYTVQSGDSCDVIDTQFNITLTQFLTWNPEINSQCSNILAGVQYCVAGPSSGGGTTTTTTSAAAPTGSGTITPGQGCKQYYTVVSGDNCSVLESEFGITLAQFINWNPEINSQCTNLELGVQYCISGP
ncbi:hypothetical protein V8D89_004813 [Ganoderma adspersum]